jgi:YebC/PmpR family DNA-binding regulatory protein
MAGHSKWANIKHRKAAQDNKRGKVFTKIIREIVVAAKQGGGAPEDNPKLRQVIDKALNANMTRDTINRAISRGVGGGDDTNMEEVSYEGYGPGGVAVLVECLTDNRNRTVSEVRHAFSKHGGNLGTEGSVAYLFSRKGQLLFADDIDEDKLFNLAIDSGAEDIISNDDNSVEVITEWTELMHVKDSLVKQGFTPANAEVTMIPSTTSALDQEQAEKITKLIDRLEDLDDVQNVYTNADF